MEVVPADVKAKTRKHAGKWVALVDGRVLTADRFRGQIRRDLKGSGRTDALVAWVPVDDG